MLTVHSSGTMIDILSLLWNLKYHFVHKVTKSIPFKISIQMNENPLDAYKKWNFSFQISTN